jgi:Na+/proline symporter
MNAPNTLQEFINLTKGIEYIIALLFLLVFPVFWKLLNKRGKSQHK